MPTPITHAVFSLAAGGAIFRRPMPLKFYLLTAFCAVLADVDTIGLRLGVPYDSLLGHRGLLHSLPFAAVLSAAVVLIGFRKLPLGSPKWWAFLGFFFLIAAAHGLLDTATNGGLGVALLSPFENGRYFLPFRPVLASPIGPRRFFTPWGMQVIASEILWIWMPMALLCLAVWVLSAKNSANTSAKNSVNSTNNIGQPNDTERSCNTSD